MIMGSNVYDDVQRAQDDVKRAQAHLESCKRTRDDAKQNGNYKNAAKCYNVGGKSVNTYDVNVYHAQEALKSAKTRLAEAKRKK